MAKMKISAKLWLAIIVLAVISPLGLILPEYFKAGNTFEESKITGPWKAPFPEYSINACENKGIFHSGLAYMISAFVGVVAVAFVMSLIAKKSRQTKRQDRCQ